MGRLQHGDRGAHVGDLPVVHGADVISVVPGKIDVVEHDHNGFAQFSGGAAQLLRQRRQGAQPIAKTGRRPCTR